MGDSFQAENKKTLGLLRRTAACSEASRPPGIDDAAAAPLALDTATRIVPLCIEHRQLRAELERKFEVHVAVFLVDGMAACKVMGNDYKLRKQSSAVTSSTYT
ncbi:hypothetical protein WJX74_008446 [Apatococcus lobatus]|uniref:Uncharacterized protein n=1 Tax=Apatococcus lobatus TaxID=904363 RepID=A0AAW1RRM3_9CHLO